MVNYTTGLFYPAQYEIIKLQQDLVHNTISKAYSCLPKDHIVRRVITIPNTATTVMLSQSDIVCPSTLILKREFGATPKITWRTGEIPLEKHPDKNIIENINICITHESHKDT